MSGAQRSVLYLGDTSLHTSAAYLGGVMRHFGIPFQYAGSDEPADRLLEDTRYSLFVLSDYPARNFKAGQMERIAEAVEGGSGLLMIGGWESFQGAGGEYHGTVIEEILPVAISTGDDRVNYSFPCLVCKRGDHEILADLPLGEPPCIGGFNRVTAKGETEVLLQAARYRCRAGGSACSFVEEGRDVLLAVGRRGRGRTAAFTSDAAPHWVGGFVDWGERRIAAELAGTRVEVGELYARFFSNLIRWTARM